jgi:hypothetical protein
LFDLLGWAERGRGATTRRALVDRASRLPAHRVPGRGAERLRATWPGTTGDVANAAAVIEEARRKLEAVRQGNGTHAADAATLSGKLEGVQHTLRDLKKQQ